MATTYLTRTPSSTGSQTKFTFSCWVKKSATGTNGVLYSCGHATSANYYTDAVFNSDDLLRLNWYNDSGNQQIRTNRKFRDTNGFYHIVIAWDTTQATASDRVKIYVNGVQETSFASATYPNQNQAMLFNTASKQIEIGRAVDDSNYFDGVLSHIHGIDGTAYDASAFGSTDSTTGEWKINTSPSVSYGTNGFFILKDGNSVTDQSGNSNNFTVGLGTLTKTEDTPSNVFATFNPLDGYVSHMVFSHGNNTVDNGSTATNKSYARSTLGASSGKFYFEAKNITNANYQAIGITDKASGGTDGELGGSSADYVYRNEAGKKGNNNNFNPYGNSYTTNDIIGCAVDLDNLKIYFSKNGVWQNSGVPTSGSTGTGAAFTITAPSLTSTGFYFFAVGDNTAANSPKWSANFGNGYFGTTAVSSAGTNASGNGIFEYDVPTGFTALSTKGLNL